MNFSLNTNRISAGVRLCSAKAVGTGVCGVQLVCLKGLLIVFLIGISLGASIAQTHYRSNANPMNWSEAGNWQIWNGGGWVTATTYPGEAAGTGDVTIQDGHTVTIDRSPAQSITRLFVGEGSSGILQYEAANARTLMVSEMVRINTGGIFRSALIGTITAHQLEVGGSIVNTGTLDFSTTAGDLGTTVNAAGAGITFTENPNSSGLFDLSNATRTNLRASNGVILNKGNVLSFTPGGQFQVLSANAVGFLTIQSGMFSLMGENTFTNPLFYASTGSYTIPSGGGFQLDNPNATISGIYGTLTNNGVLIIKRGVFNVGDGTGNESLTTSTGRFEMSGGRMDISGRFRVDAGNCIITGGTLNLATIGHANRTLAAFHILESANLTISGDPLITFAFPNSNSDPFNDIEIVAGAGTKTITGGTFQMGTTATPATRTFLVNSDIPIHNLVVFNTNSRVSLTDHLTINNQLTLNGPLLMNNFNLNLGVPAIAGDLRTSHGMILTGTGQIHKTIHSTGSYVFPFGNSSGAYLPATLNFTGGAFTSVATVSVRMFNSNHPQNVNTTNYLNRYWTIRTSGITNPVYNFTGTYTNLSSEITGSDAYMTTGVYTTAWRKLSASNNIGTTIYASGLTENVDITGINSAAAAPEVTVTATPASVCSGEPVQLRAAASGEGTLTYSWTPTDGLNDPNRADPEATLTVATPTTIVYTVTVTDGMNESTSARATVTVNSNMTVTAPSTTPTLCISTLLTAITHTTTLATGITNDGVSGANGLPAGISAHWEGNTITISGTPTASGTFNYSITLTGGCGAVNATGTITVTPANTAGAGSSSPTLCINTALPSITHATTRATGIDEANGLPAGVTAAWASNTITISGTPTESGTFNYSIPLTGGCEAVNATGTITVTSANTAGAASSSPTLCINTALTNITHTTTGATEIGGATGLPAGVTAAWADNVITISGTPTESGTFNYSIPLTGGCGNVNATGTITITSANTAEAASLTPTLCINNKLTNITHTTTGATGIGVATGLPAGVTAAWASNTITISGTPTASGTFNYSIPLTGGCETVNATGTITVTTGNTAGVASSAPTLCINTPLTNITHSTSGATGIGISTGLPAGVTAAWTSNTITISGTPTATGSFNYSIPLTGGCETVNATGTITVIPANTTGTASSAPTLCINTSLTNITHFTTGATGIGVATGLPTGVTAAWASNTITLSGTPTASGTFNYSIPLTGGCGAVNAMGTITVTPANTVGAGSSSPTLCISTVLTAITHSTTGATGIGVATGLPAGVTAAWASNTITISGTPTASGTFNYSIPLTGGCGTVYATGIITVTPAMTVTTASSSPTPCINTGMTTITHITTGATGIGIATGLPAGVTAVWVSNTITISGIPTASGTFNYSIPLTGGCGSVNATGSITVNHVASGQVAGDQTICLNGNPDAFTEITAATGTNLTYRWERAASPFIVWSTIPFATGATYDPPGPMIQTMLFRRVAISTLAGSVCESISNIVTVLVLDAVAAGQIGTNQTICNGETPNAIVSIVDGTGGSGSIIYSWEMNSGAGWLVIPDEIGSGLVLPALTQSTMYRRYTVATIGGTTCHSQATVAVTITVQTVPTAGTITASQTICNGTAPLPLISIHNGTVYAGATISYQWWQSIDGGTNWTIMSGANSSTYTPGALTNSSQFRRVTVATLNGHACFSVPTNTVIITIQAVVQEGQIAGDQIICYNGDPSQLTSAADGTGSGTITYRWENSSGGGPWTIIAGATNSTYDPTGPLAITTLYRRTTISTLNSIACVSSNPTSYVTVTVLPQMVAPAASENQIICYNTSPTTLTRTNATGGSNGFTYQWQSSPDNLTWTNIIGQSGLIYSPGNLTATTYYRVEATEIGTPSCGIIYSNAVTITVRPQLVAPSICCDQIVCIGSSPDPLNGIAASGGSGTFTYQWQWSANGNPPWNNIGGATNSNVYTPPTQSRYYRLIATDPVCGVAPPSNTVQVSLGFDFGASFSDDGNPTSAVCPGYRFNYTINSGTIGGLFGRHVRYSLYADPAYVLPATGGPVGQTLYWWFLPYFQATIPFTVYNNTNAPVTTTITITPSVFVNPGPPPSQFVCNLTPQTFNVTINPFRLLCQTNISATTAPGTCAASVNIPPFQWVANSCIATINWTMSGATNGSGRGNMGTRTFNQGTTTVNYTSTSNGVTTTCSFTVTVADAQSPTITCPGNITQPATAGLCSAVVNYIPPLGTDNCTGAVTTQITGLPSGSTFPVGTTTNTFRVTDASNNTAECSFTITITDIEPPTIADCPTNYTLYTDPLECFANLDPDDPTISDNCSALLSLTWTMTMGGVTTGSSPLTGINYIGSTNFNTGVTTIIYTLTDAGGHPATCSFTVTVIDNEPAAISCPFGVNVGVNAGECTYTFTPNPPLYSDNCSVTSLTWVMSGVTTGASSLFGINFVPSTAFNPGITTITYTVTDAGGNTATSCPFTVTVTDDIPPTITCPASPQTRNANTGECSYTAIGSEFDPVAFDNCPGYILENNLNFGSTLEGYIFPVGTRSIIWTLRDGANTVRACTFNVTVIDNQPPVIICPTQPVAICADINGNYTHSGTSWDATATDNCSVVSMSYTLSGSTTGTGASLIGVVFNSGTTHVVWHAADIAGNPDECTFDVVVHPLPTPSAIYHN